MGAWTCFSINSFFAVNMLYPHYSAEVIAYTKDICNYIYETYGRFPAHVDAMFVPGVWIQAHHLDLAYYDQLYN